MPGKPGASGGKRAGAGRKPGKVKPGPKGTLRGANRALVTDLIAGRRKHPLVALLDLAEVDSTPVAERIRAYVGALPFLMPRLSMAVVADVTPKGGPGEVDQAQLMARMLGQLDRLQASTANTIETTAKQDGNDPCREPSESVSVSVIER